MLLNNFITRMVGQIMAGGYLMKWFHDLKISFKFIGCFSAILVILIIGNVMGYFNASSINSNLTNMYENDLTSIKELGSVSSAFQRINTSVGSYLLINDANSRKKEKEIITAKQNEIETLLTSISSKPLTENENMELNLFTSLWSQYPKSISKVLDLADQNQNEFARSAFEREILTKQDGIVKTFQSFIEMNQTKADTRYADSMNMYQRIKWSTITVMVVSLLISGILGSLMTFSILTPIRRLLQAFKNIESGDLSQAVVIQRRDELGQLAVGFEKMRESVASIVSQTKHAVGILANVSNDIRGNAQTTGASSQQIFDGLKDAAQVSTQQAAKITDDAIVIKEMSIGLKQVATNIDDVSTLSSDMESASEKGQVVVRDALDKMSSIQQTSQQTTNIVKDLGEQSQEIDSVITTIKNIAEETNLLALNASIEAARAGEAGKGFAVVASEVRKLAESSKSAADHVGTVVARIQESTRGLLRSNQAWTLELNEGHAKVNDVSAAFKQINEWIQNMNNSVQDITAGIEEMAAGSEQIDTSMKRIEDYSGNVSQVNEEYAEKSGQQVHMMDKVNTSVEELLKISEELHIIVNRFKTA
jgi:methyl-accepting chemotaxis protein